MLAWAEKRGAFVLTGGKKAGENNPGLAKLHSEKEKKNEKQFQHGGNKGPKGN